MSNIGKDFNGVSHESVRAIIRDSYNLHHSWPVSVELMSVYPRNDGTSEYEFNAIFEYKNDWHDDGIVEKFITVSIRDNY